MTTIKSQPQTVLTTVQESLTARRLWMALEHTYSLHGHIYQRCINSDGSGTYQIYVEGRYTATQLAAMRAFIAGWICGYSY